LKVSCIRRRKGSKARKEIYQLLLNRYGLLANESLFIDDSLKNIETANELGFNTIHLNEPKVWKSSTKPGINLSAHITIALGTQPFKQDLAIHFEKNKSTFCWFSGNYILQRFCYFQISIIGKTCYPNYPYFQDCSNSGGSQ